jgi:hypothetical protein
MRLLAAARRLFELEKLERWEFELCMADRVLGKSLDCSDPTEHWVDLAGDFGALVVHLVVAAAGDSEDPLVDRRCYSFAVAQTLEALVRPAVTHEAAKRMRNIFNGDESSHLNFIFGIYRQQLRHVLCWVSELRKINEITMKRLMIRHTLDRLSHVLKVLDRLDQAAIFVENLLNVCWTRWRRPWSAKKPRKNIKITSDAA